ncbi:MAG: S1 RNA-binding domain-containing protein [Planctomycetes bacterium]|nr:S1 RNA-binding domain-containing protein [Planctomycetota bacterium]
MLSLTARSRIASEFQVAPDVIATFEERLAAGDSIPFLARRYPDRLGDLDATSLRRLRARVEEARELELRRANILKSIDALGESGEVLKAQAQAAFDRWHLEDLAAKLRKPKGTRGAEAISKGLEPLAAAISASQHDGKSLLELAAPFVTITKIVVAVPESSSDAAKSEVTTPEIATPETAALEPAASTATSDAKTPEAPSAVATTDPHAVATAQEALHGAAAILAEQFAAEFEIRQRVRREIRERGEIVSKVFDASRPGADRYKEFFDLRARGKSMAPRRYLKLRQAEKERIVKFTVELNFDETIADLAKRILGELPEDASEQNRACYEFKKTALHDAVTRILQGAIEVDIRTEWKERADLEAIGFLRRNLRELCMTAPYGPHVAMGVDPGARKGVRVAIAAKDGGFLAEASFQYEGDGRAAAIAEASNLIKTHGVRAIAISDDTESDDIVKFFRDVIQTFGADAPVIEASNPAAHATDSPAPDAAVPNGAEHREADVTNAEGASVDAEDAGHSEESHSEETHSEEAAPENAVSPPELLRVPGVGVASVANSPIAREEFGDRPVPVRAAMSMARRLQDPLAEYSRLDPKLLAGYHHGQDIAKSRLEKLLNEEFDACVHEVPIDLNLAPAALLALVGDLGIDNAKKIVEWRKSNGNFPSRVSLARVGLEEKVYQRAVAFLRVLNGADPLDETGVHPDHAPAAQKLVAAAGVASLKELTHELLKGINVASFVDDTAPLSVISLVRDLLMDGSRDPRGTFRPTVVNVGVRGFNDLKPNLELDGVVRGIAQFGVFVDIGIGQDGLMHVSELADHFVKDARDIVKLGDRVRVRVIEVNPQKRKISLTMRSEEARQRANEERQMKREARQAARERQRERRRRIAEMRQKHEESLKAAEAGAIVTDPAAPPVPTPDNSNKSFELLSSTSSRSFAKPATTQRVAVARRDDPSGKRRGGGGRPGDARGKPRRDSRNRDDSYMGGGDEGTDEVRKNAPKPEPTAPPANAFKKFFQSKGLIEGQ